MTAPCRTTVQRVASCSRLRMERIELVLQERAVAPAHFHRHVIEPALGEPAIEMAQAGDDHTHHRHLNIGPGLVENKEVESLSSSNIHGSRDLFVRGELTELGARSRAYFRAAAREQ